MLSAQEPVGQQFQPIGQNNPPMAGQSQYQRQSHQQQYPGTSGPGPNAHSQNSYGSVDHLGQRMSHLGFQVKLENVFHLLMFSLGARILMIVRDTFYYHF